MLSRTNRFVDCVTMAGVIKIPLKIKLECFFLFLFSGFLFVFVQTPLLIIQMSMFKPRASKSHYTIITSFELEHFGAFSPTRVSHSDFDSLSKEDVAENNQLAFDVAEREFGIQPVIRGEEMAAQAEPDQLLIVLYLSKFYEAFRLSPGNGSGQVPSCLFAQRFLFRQPRLNRLKDSE